MDKILTFLIDLADNMYEADYSDFNSGWIFGCECGCGGDFYSDNPDMYDDAVEHEEAVQKSIEALMIAVDADEEYVRTALTSLSYIEDKPNPEDTWYSDGGDYKYDLDSWSHYVASYAPFVADLMQRMESRGVHGQD